MFNRHLKMLQVSVKNPQVDVKHYLGCQPHVGLWQPQEGQPQVGLDGAYCPRMEVRTKVGV